MSAATSVRGAITPDEPFAGVASILFPLPIGREAAAGTSPLTFPEPSVWNTMLTIPAVGAGVVALKSGLETDNPFTSTAEPDEATATCVPIMVTTTPL